MTEPCMSKALRICTFWRDVVCTNRGGRSRARQKDPESSYIIDQPRVALFRSGARMLGLAWFPRLRT